MHWFEACNFESGIVLVLACSSISVHYVGIVSSGSVFSVFCYSIDGARVTWLVQPPFMPFWVIHEVALVLTDGIWQSLMELLTGITWQWIWIGISISCNTISNLWTVWGLSELQLYINDIRKSNEKKCVILGWCSRSAFSLAIEIDSLVGILRYEAFMYK